MPLEYWWETFHTVVFLINRLLTPMLSGQNPYQVLFDKQLDYLPLKVFWCDCFPFLTL